MKKLRFLTILIVTLINIQCDDNHPSVDKITWGELNDKSIFLFTLENKNGMKVKITNYGGIITSIITKDKFGTPDDVVLGFDNLEQYLAPNPCFGAAIGRYTNRIRNASFTIDGKAYQLTKNTGEHNSHGANEFNRAVWDSEVITTPESTSIKLHYLSKDGSNGFPGNLDSYITYTLTNTNELKLHYEATTDKPTHVGFTNHSYFNLSGLKENIYNHIIEIKASKYTEIDSLIIPTGKIASVTNKLWDVSNPTRIGDHIHKLNHNGYHYNYVFDKHDANTEVIKVTDPNSGRIMSIKTTQPGVQFYSGNSIQKFIGKKGIEYGAHSGFCLETQHFPDSPNHKNFPSTLLLPGELYDELTTIKFSTVAP